MAVTVIVATYNRPDALTAALSSLRMQTFQDWRGLIIGDCCDERTGVAVAAMADSRLTYINVPIRSGEQSGPNSVGMRLAQTPVLAFLNHDDIWLPDHLETALAALERSPGTDMFFGRAAIAYHSLDENGARRPFFSICNPENRTLMDAFHRPMSVFEPASALVLRKPLADRIGDWRAAHEIHRLPFEEWLLRAARASAELALDPLISVLKVTTHNQAGPDQKQYEWGAEEQNFLLQLIAEKGAEGARAMIAADLQIAAANKMAPTDSHKKFLNEPEAWLADRLLTPQLADVYLRTGLDAYDILCELAGRQRGATLVGALQNRTGESVETRASIDALIAAINRV
jgi:hypothetical protein